MTGPQFGFSAPEWWLPALAFVGVATALLAMSYSRARPLHGRRWLSAILKGLGIAALAACLLEPRMREMVPRPRANLCLVVADDSQSMELTDPAGRSLAEQTRTHLVEPSDWRTRLEDQFDVRTYRFDQRLESVRGDLELTFAGRQSSLFRSLTTLGSQYLDRPVAAVLLFSDGIATDELPSPEDTPALPPIFPVVSASGDEAELRDLGVTSVAVSQTNFEANPVTISGQVGALSDDGGDVLIELVNPAGDVLESVTESSSAGEWNGSFRFVVRPESTGVEPYTVRASWHRNDTPEATEVNNARTVVVDRGGGPYRILYVSGRPNWEFKFLRRALDKDPELELIGLLRIAKRQPRFAFGDIERGRNQLFDGFDGFDETDEQHDEPVLVRLGTEDSEELRSGFPTTAEELFAYDALVIDDLEAKFFSHDQQQLIHDYVTRRGGGLIMLGGAESFADGGYDDTVLEDLLPVYLESTGRAPAREVRLELTRDGWLHPWVRLRSTENEERQRIANMPPFRIVHALPSLKPAAVELLRAVDQAGDGFPALVMQRVGRGRTAAVAIGDLWRWQLRSENPEQDDAARAWRQALRWIVSDTPARLEAESEVEDRFVKLVARVRDERFGPQANARVVFTVEASDGTTEVLPAAPSDSIPGTYEARTYPRETGFARATVRAETSDGEEVGEREFGWAFAPATREFRELRPDRAQLRSLASETGGELVTFDQLDKFVRDLEQRDLPMLDPIDRPLWHRWWWFALAIACLCAEWALRRTGGLA